MTRGVSESDLREIADALGARAQALSGKSVLLCGGAGFLGRYFIEVIAWLGRHVLEAPARLTVLDNLKIAHDGAAAQLPEDCRFIRHDIVRPYLPEESFDYIVQAAGIASPYHYRAFPLETLEVATLGTKNMLELARRDGARMLYFSSSEIYGDPDPVHVPTPESYRGNVNCQGPRACYDEGKRLGETLCYVYHAYHGVACNAVRPFNIYGPGMREDDYRVLPNFASRVRGGRALHLYGSGNQTRTYCYITDAIDGFLRVLLNGVPGEVYNIGNPEPELSVHALADRIADVLGRPLERVVVDYPDSYPTDEPQRRCPDIRKARLQLGYAPRVALDEGLARFFAWTERHYLGRN